MAGMIRLVSGDMIVKICEKEPQGSILVVVQAPTVFISFAGAQGSRFVLQSFPGWEGTSGLTGAGLFKIRVQGSGFRV